MSAKESNVLRMKELIEKLKEADVDYYRDDDPIMSGSTLIRPCKGV